MKKTITVDNGCNIGHLNVNNAFNSYKELQIHTGATLPSLCLIAAVSAVNGGSILTQTLTSSKVAEINTTHYYTFGHSYPNPYSPALLQKKYTQKAPKLNENKSLLVRARTR